jgi:two-component system response regulator RegA
VNVSPILGLLVVDDSEVFRNRLAQAFRERGYTVSTAANADEAVAIVQSLKISHAVLDLKMPGRSGMVLLKELRDLNSSIRIVILTGFGSIATAVEAMRLGAVNFVPKPADADDVLAAFEIEPELPDPDCRAEVGAPTLAQAEWEHIQRILNDCGGNVSEAARRLGIHRRSLQRKLHKLAP